MTVALALMACRSDREREHQAHVLLLADHIDRLRTADNAQKRAPLERLTALPCEGADACALKELCARAYGVHQAALDAIEALRGEAARDAGASASELRTRISHAERELGRAKQLTQSCAEEQVRVVRKVLM